MQKNYTRENLNQKIDSETRNLWNKFVQLTKVTSTFPKLNFAIMGWSGVVQNSFVFMKNELNDEEFIEKVDTYMYMNEECCSKVIRIIEEIKNEDGNDEVYRYINLDDILHVKQRIDSLLNEVKKLVD